MSEKNKGKVYNRYDLNPNRESNRIGMKQRLIENEEEKG